MIVDSYFSLKTKLLLDKFFLVSEEGFACPPKQPAGEPAEQAVCAKQCCEGGNPHFAVRQNNTCVKVQIIKI